MTANCLDKITDIKLFPSGKYFDDTVNNIQRRYYLKDDNTYQQDKLVNNKYEFFIKGTWMCGGDTTFIKTESGGIYKLEGKKWVNSTQDELTRLTQATTTELSDVEKFAFEKMRKENVSADEALEYLNKAGLFLSQTQKEEYVKKYKEYLANPTPSPASTDEDLGMSEFFKKWKKSLLNLFDTDEPKKEKLASWVPECLKKKNVLQTTNEGKFVDNQVVTQTNTDREYYWESGSFAMINKRTNVRENGKWSCKTGKLIITTESGDKFEEGKGWKYDHTSTTPVQTTQPTQITTPTQTTPTQITKPQETESPYVGFGEI